MKNIYDGVAVLNEKGLATLTMPDWFEALNQDFRYRSYLPMQARFRLYNGVKMGEQTEQVKPTKRERHVKSFRQSSNDR
ncbi:MAG TPA: hypothetical protein VF762_22685 [Blastocatellia bacterium]|jgi:hypothetical protein